MSIQKITQSEILKNGIKGLPTRPSTPSLYQGNIFSAEELKAAFDKLPALIAERFNALLDAAGLYDANHPADTLAALISTDIEASHSLRDFFADVKNGNLSLYLAAGESGEPLADVLAELRTAIEKNKRYAITVEGDGDLLTNVILDEDEIKIQRDGTTAKILEAAKEYTDAPTGSVIAGCTSPVSGGTVFRAIEKFNEDQSERITTLENAAKDILYTYPVVEDAFSHIQTSDNTLPNAALLRLGGTPMERYNLFPEQTLFNFQNGDLTITWDDEEKVLIMNGTLRASETPLHIAPFMLALPFTCFSAAVFYRSGTASTEKAKISIVSDTEELFTVPITSSREQHHSGAYLEGTKFIEIELMATEDTVFSDYRFNLLISHEQPTVHYEPFDSKNRFLFPKRLVALGPNCWNGTDTLMGESFISIKPNIVSETGEYIFGFTAQSTATTKMLVCFYNQNNMFYKVTWPRNEYQMMCITSEIPITEARIYAANTVDASEGHTVHLKNIYLDFVGLDYTIDGQPYLPYHRDEIIFPEVFEQFSPLFLGWGDKNCNYFDLEHGHFVEGYHSLTIDGELPFEAVEDTPGRFSASFAVPQAIKDNKNNFRPSSIFSHATKVGKNETLCFTSDSVIVQSEIFVGKTADDVKRFLNMCPIDVVYKESSIQKHLLKEEEPVFYDAPTIRLKPGCHLYFANAEEQMINVFSSIQYQIKQKTEETE